MSCSVRVSGLISFFKFTTDNYHCRRQQTKRTCLLCCLLDIFSCLCLNLDYVDTDLLFHILEGFRKQVYILLEFSLNGFH